MSTHVEGDFTVTSWDEQTHESLQGESKLTKVSIVQEYTAGLEATGAWEGLMFYAADGTAFFTGLQRFVGALDGREGTFVVEARGEYNGSEATTDWRVLAQSGTGELVGLQGSGSATAASGMSGTYSFDYDIS